MLRPCEKPGMRSRGLLTVLYTAFSTVLLLVKKVGCDMASNQTQLRCTKVCSRYSSFQEEDASTGFKATNINYVLPGDLFVRNLLDQAPCPPPWKINVLCDSRFDKFLTCSEKSAILTKCLESSFIKIDIICQTLKACATVLKCRQFTEYKSEYSNECSHIDYVTLTSNNMVTITGGYHTTVSSASGGDGNGTVNGGSDSVNHSGDVTIVIIVLVIFAVIFIPLILYLLLKRHNRHRISRCCRTHCSRCCPCRRKPLLEDDEIAVISSNTNHVDGPVHPITTTYLTSTMDNPTMDINLLGDDDNAIGSMEDSFDFGFADEDTPSEYKFKL